MKNYEKIIIGLLAFMPLMGCSPENDIKIPESTTFAFYEQFNSFTEQTEGNSIALSGWTNFAEVGTVKWEEGYYNGTKYAEFTSYQSGQATNIAWLVSPAINMDIMDNETLAFDVAQAYVSSSSNSIDLLVSTNYDGTNVLAANWQPLSFTKPPLDFDTNFDFFSSGLVDLSSYTGSIYLAFRCKGSGTNFSLDGTYELDNIRIFDKK
ncbi:hypothetical protein [Flavobacterium sp.]|jgi:hypothetical protein|uniref:hypothetical protein n=1 Tax=Flavobacterium sp. TaxID=239 RepID=UPI0037BECC00